MAKMISCCLALCICFGLTVLAQAPAGQLGQAAGRGPAPAPAPDNPQSLAHVDAARKLAGNDPFLKQPYDFYCIPTNSRPNNPQAPELEPVKIFDDLYALGNSETTIYALITSDGIVLFDSGFADRVETVTVAGLQKLGLDPTGVKYIMLGHGHGDHIGGAAHFQEKYGTRVAAMGAEWDALAAPPANPNQQRLRLPKRDIDLKDGEAVKIGNATVTAVAIPGHTPGGAGYVFPVKDRGRTRIAAMFGGTILTPDRQSVESLKQYTASIAHWVDVAKKMNVEVEVQNHALFDDTPARLARLKTLKGNEPNPFVIGNDRYVKMWSIVSECVQAAAARRGATIN